jgi:hypothetical protein
VNFAAFVVSEPSTLAVNTLSPSWRNSVNLATVRNQVYDRRMKGLGWEVFWSTVVYLNGRRVSFQLKARRDRIRLDLTFQYQTGSVTYDKVDLQELQRIEDALLAMMGLLGSSGIDELARKKKDELENLGFAARLWRRINDPHLLREIVPVGFWDRICFRVESDKQAYIDVASGEDGGAIPVELKDIEAFADGLAAAIGAMRLGPASANTGPHYG